MPFNITVTEGLAEIKTIEKRIAKKAQFISQYLLRQEKMKDPLAKDGGSLQVIAAERQAIGDLWQRSMDIRVAIYAANDRNTIEINKRARSITEWLMWRKDVAPNTQTFLGSIRQGIDRARGDATKRGASAIIAGQEARPEDIIVNIDEASLAHEIEAMEDTLGRLDGLLSLKNATITI